MFLEIILRIWYLKKSIEGEKKKKRRGEKADDNLSWEK